MEGVATLKGFHTCKETGTWEFIWNNTPFKSEANNRQWLTQGYYFWTDSDYFAHKWGRQSYNGSYAIICCSIQIEKSLFLDLVGSVENQLYFKKILDLFYEKLKTADPIAKPPTINAVLTFYRDMEETNNGAFPFLAIKAADAYQEEKFNFIENYSAFLTVPSRQQLCLFDKAYDCIKEKYPVYPEDFKTEIENGRK